MCKLLTHCTPLNALNEPAPPADGHDKAAAAEGSAATITFRKVFKSSYPEFVEIKLSDSGAGTFDIRQLDEAENPQPFGLSAPTVQKIFSLAAKLRDFDGVDLEVHRRIANLGQKTFRYEKGAEVHEVTFNYTQDPSASQLLEIFEGLSREEQDLADLERTMRYDRLGVNDVLIQTQADLDDKIMPEPGRLLPALDQAAADERIINVARDRARALAARIRSGR